MDLPFVVLCFLQKDNVWLVARVQPEISPYLPDLSRHDTQADFLPYRCFRITCERLYNQAACFIQYSPGIPQRFYEGSGEQDLVITEVIGRGQLPWAKCMYVCTYFYSDQHNYYIQQMIFQILKWWQYNINAFTRIFWISIQQTAPSNWGIFRHYV